MEQTQGDATLTRVVLIGAESTGKTTLAQQLAAHYDTVWAPEYLRLFVDRKGALPEPADTPVLVQGHLAQEEALAPTANRILFLDTDLVATCVYSRYYFGACPAWLERLSYEHSADLYLLTDTDIPWQPDPGQRDGPEVRATLHTLFRRALKTRGVPHLLLSGPLEQRMSKALQAIQKLLCL